MKTTADQERKLCLQRPLVFTFLFLRKNIQGEKQRDNRRRTKKDTLILRKVYERKQRFTQQKKAVKRIKGLKNTTNLSYVCHISLHQSFAGLCHFPSFPLITTPDRLSVQRRGEGRERRCFISFKNGKSNLFRLMTPVQETISIM